MKNIIFNTSLFSFAHSRSGFHCIILLNLKKKISYQFHEVLVQSLNYLHSIYKDKHLISDYENIMKFFVIFNDNINQKSLYLILFGGNMKEGDIDHSKFSMKVKIITVWYLYEK